MNFSSSQLTKIVALSLLLTLSACGNGSGGDAVADKSILEMQGHWIEDFDQQAIDNLKDQNGDCRPYQVTSSEDLGRYYLELIQINQIGQVFDSGTINRDRPGEHNFIEKGRLSANKKLTLSPVFVQRWQQAGVTFKEYDHEYRLKDEKTLELLINKQVVKTSEGELEMKNEKNTYFKLSQTEFDEVVRFAHDCAKKQTLAP